MLGCSRGTAGHPPTNLRRRSNRPHRRIESHRGPPHPACKRELDAPRLSPPFVPAFQACPFGVATVSLYHAATHEELALLLRLVDRRCRVPPKGGHNAAPGARRARFRSSPLSTREPASESWIPRPRAHAAIIPRVPADDRAILHWFNPTIQTVYQTNGVTGHGTVSRSPT